MNEKLYLRPVNKDDARLLFEWANDSDVRHNSFNSAHISWDEHKLWVERVLNDENTLLYILMEADNPIGQVRLVNCGKWQISYSIAPVYRGHGYGKILLQLAENKLVVDGHEGEKLYAEVKKDNIPSQRIFIGLDYIEVASKHGGAYAYEKTVGCGLYI